MGRGTQAPGRDRWATRWPLAGHRSQHHSTYNDPYQLCYATDLDQTLRGAGIEILASFLLGIAVSSQPVCGIAM